jgi:hypothetical protein
MDRMMMSTLNNITKLKKNKEKRKTLPDSNGHKFALKTPKKKCTIVYAPFHKIV